MTQSEHSLSLSELNFARYFPRAVHPDTELIKAHVTQQCHELNICLEHYENYNTLGSYLFPHADMTRVKVISLLMDYLYYIDDLYDRHKAEAHPDTSRLPMIFKTSIAIMMKGEAAMPDHPEPVYRGALALYQAFSNQSNPEWYGRFMRSITTHLATSRDLNSTPGSIDVETYIAMREEDGGMWPTMDLIEFATETYLPEAVRTHPHLQKMQRICSQLGTLTNDMFSYEKEVIRMGSRFNVIVILMEKCGMTFSEAVSYNMNYLNHLIDEFMVRYNNLPDFGDEISNHAARVYADGIFDILCAAWHWEMSTTRYCSPESPFEELRRAA